MAGGHEVWAAHDRRVNLRSLAPSNTSPAVHSRECVQRGVIAIIGGGSMEHATLSVVPDIRTPVSGFDPPIV